MKEAEFSTHTVKSHGYKVARIHFHDWILVLVLMVIYVFVYSMNPYYRFVGKDMMTDLKYPMKSITVPSWAVSIYAVVFPISVFFAFYFWRRDVYDLHHGTLGLLVSVLITGIITETIKNGVGRPRPDFFWRCFPDGKDVYDQLGKVVCHGEDSIIKDGHKSFPSGLASWSFAGLGFLSLYLSGKINAFDRRGHVAKLCIVILPLLIATLSSISVVDDYIHHWTDVFAGGLLGLALATLCYLQFFPPPYHTNGSGPYAYFQVLEELQNATQLTNSNVRIVQEQSEQNNHENVGDCEALDCSLIEVECGRRSQSERVPLLLNTLS